MNKYEGIEVIGVDVGNGFCKTVNSSFVSSVKNCGEVKPSLMDKVVKYNNKYYIVGGDRTKTKTDKKEDETSLILALAGIGEELKFRGKNNTKVLLSEGLPLERCHDENKQIDEAYYQKGKEIYFEYEDVPYNIFMEDVIVNPQCVAGIIDFLNEKSEHKLPDPCIVIDIGSWTMDILPIENKKPQGAKVKSLNDGVINCMLKCNEEIRKRTGIEVLESQIQQIMMGEESTLPALHTKLIQDTIKKYVKDIADTLIENKYNVNTLTCVFMGGGAKLIQMYGQDYFPLSRYILNIRANAVGYEKIGKMKLGKKDTV